MAPRITPAAMRAPRPSERTHREKESPRATNYFRTPIVIQQHQLSVIRFLRLLMTQEGGGRGLTGTN